MIVFIKILTMVLLVLLALCSFLRWTSAADCPYDKLSSRHSFCMKPNLYCSIKHSGVSRDEIREILKVHNAYRSEVALGSENRAFGGVLPQASDMMQMVWDDELAGIAQKWANNCIYQHDCRECRAVDDYPVGQNIAYQDLTCPNQQCFDSITDYQLKPDWGKVLRDFYDEVKDFDKRIGTSFQEVQGRVIGHFTQMIWAQTWRVGCGFTVFKMGLKYRRFYVCNYGPTGNIQEKPVYKIGKPCSACPINSCCGPSCQKAAEYPGLCKMLNPNTAPVYPRNVTDLIFYCDGRRGTSDCAAKVTGNDKWSFKSSLLGNYVSIVLDGGESSTLVFKKTISPTQLNFCVRMVLKKGPLKAGLPDRGRLVAEFNPNSYLPSRINVFVTSTVYIPFNLDLNWRAETKFSLTFSADKFATPQKLDIQEILAYDGKCNSRTF